MLFGEYLGALMVAVRAIKLQPRERNSRERRERLNI